MRGLADIWHARSVYMQLPKDGRREQVSRTSLARRSEIDAARRSNASALAPAMSPRRALAVAAARRVCARGSTTGCTVLPRRDY